MTYRIEQIDGSYSTTATTDSHGRIFLDSIPVGTYRVTEANVPSYCDEWCFSPADCIPLRVLLGTSPAARSAATRARMWPMGMWQ